VGRRAEVVVREHVAAPARVDVPALPGRARAIAAFVLSHGEQNANVRGALAHVISDALGSLAAVAAALFILGLGFHLADPLASLAPDLRLCPR
jgi:cobalt-zinc-cadmium efflux system protein